MSAPSAPLESRVWRVGVPFKFRLSFAAKLLLLVLLPLAVVVGVTVPLVVNGMTRLENDTSLARLRDEVAIISQQFAKAESALTMQADALANDPVLAGIINRRDAAGIQQNVQAALIRSGLDYLRVSDVSGGVLAREYSSPGLVIADESQHVGPLTLTKVRTTRLLPTDQGWMLTAVQPITDRGNLVGTLLAGRLFDDRALSQLNFDRSDPLLVFFDAAGNPQVHGGTKLGGNLNDAFHVDRGLWTRAKQGQTVLTTTTIEEEGYRVAYGPLVVDGAPAAAFSLALSTKATAGLRDQLVLTHIIVIGLVAMAAIMADYFISKFIRGPIIRLKEAAEAIGAGNLDARVEIDSPDEVGSLATAFNQMADQISEATETLEDRVRERTRELEEAHELRRLQVAESARETERKRLAGELHDETMASLAAMNMKIGLMRRRAGQVSQELEEGFSYLITRIKDTDRQLRQLVSGIFPTVLTDLGLPQAVTAYLAQLAGRPIESPYPLEVEFTSQGITHQRFPEDVEINLYRVVQQGVTNTIQHAEAKQLRIDLSWKDDELLLYMSDDGRGFDVNNPGETPQSGHFGLVNFRDRIASLKGTLEIESQLGVGTTIRASIPHNGTTNADGASTSKYRLENLPG